MSWDDRPQVGEAFDWRNSDKTDQIDVHVIAADHLHNIYTGVVRRYDPVLDTYGQGELRIFRVESDGKYSLLTIDEDEDES